MASQPPAPTAIAAWMRHAVATPSVATAVKIMAVGAKAAKAPPARERVTRTGAVTHPMRPRTRTQVSQAAAVTPRRTRLTAWSTPCSWLRISVRVLHVSSASEAMAMELASLVWGIGSGSGCGSGSCCGLTVSMMVRGEVGDGRAGVVRRGCGVLTRPGGPGL